MSRDERYRFLDAGTRIGKVAWVGADGHPHVAPYAFVKINATVTTTDEPDELLRWATAIGARYMGADRADEFGRRNGAAGEVLVRLTPTKVIAEADIAGP